MIDRRSAIFEIVEEMTPMTVRQAFYQASVRGVIDKSEAGYRKVEGDLVFLRKTGNMPYEWLADHTRYQRKPDSFGGPYEALKECAALYRKDLWRNSGAYVEVWLEKDALAGVVVPITKCYDVPLMVARGYASLSFLHSAAMAIKRINKPTFIYHLGDYDPSGMNAGEKIEQTLREMAPGAEIHFERLAVTEDQIVELDLPTRLTKKSDTRAKKFGSDISVELDAIQPDYLRYLVLEAIERHLPEQQLDVLQAAEESEREILQHIIHEAAIADMFNHNP